MAPRSPGPCHPGPGTPGGLCPRFGSRPGFPVSVPPLPTGRAQHLLGPRLWTGPSRGPDVKGPEPRACFPVHSLMDNCPRGKPRNGSEPDCRLGGYLKRQQGVAVTCRVPCEHMFRPCSLSGSLHSGGSQGTPHPLSLHPEPGM